MSDILTRILRQNWPSYPHRKLFAMVRTEAAGASVLSDTEQAWAEFVALLTESRQRVDALLREAGASWEGLAADSMRAGVAPLVQWADDAGTAAQASGDGLRQVGDSFAHTAYAMPEPVRPMVNAQYANVFAGMIDRDRQEREAQEAKLRAVELMQRYSTNAHSAVSNLGIFVPPQDVTVAPVPRERSGGGPVQFGASAIVTPPPGAGRPEPPASAPDDPGPGPGPAQHDATPERSEPIPVPPTETAGRDATPPAAGAPAATTTPPAAVQSAAASQQQITGGFPAGVPIGSPATRPPSRLTDRPAPRPGAAPVGGGRQDEGAARAPGAKIAARTGATGTGPTLAPAAAARREEDKDHVSPDYLRAFHDELWEGSLPASPPVIGVEPPEH